MSDAVANRDREALSRIASRWWKGPDAGKPFEVTLELRVPTDRTREEVLDLFREVVEPLSGGYRTSVGVREVERADG